MVTKLANYYQVLREESAAVAGSRETRGRLQLLAQEGKPLRPGNRLLIQVSRESGLTAITGVAASMLKLEFPRMIVQ